MASNTEFEIRGGYVPFTLKRNPRLDLYAQGLAKLDAAAEEADNKKSAIAEAFSKARDILPNNEETNQYITDNQNEIMNNIDEQIRRGDFYGAITYSKNAGSQFFSGAEFKARTKEHEQRKEWLENLNRSSVDNYIKEYYRDTYQDRNNFTRDEQGNVTGTAGWEAPLPEQGQSATAIIQAAVKATADERTDSARDWTTAEGTGGHNAGKREWLTADKISKTAKAIIDSDGRVKQAFVDQFNAGIHQIKKLEKQVTNLEKELRGTIDLDKRKNIEDRLSSIKNQISGYKSSFYKNSAPMESAQAYIDNLFSPDNYEIKHAAYDYKHSNTGTDAYAKGSGNLTNPLNYITPNPNANPESINTPSSNRETSYTQSSMPTQGDRNNLTYIAPGNVWSPNK